jgi:hypothetical protein
MQLAIAVSPKTHKPVLQTAHFVTKAGITTAKSTILITQY